MIQEPPPIVARKIVICVVLDNLWWQRYLLNPDQLDQKGGQSAMLVYPSCCTGSCCSGCLSGRSFRVGATDGALGVD